MTKAILTKNAAACLPFPVSSLGRRHPSSVRLQRGCARRRLTEDHIRLQGDKLLRQHRRPPGRAGLATKPEPTAIGDAREHGADATLSSLSCEQNSYFAAIEGRGAQAMVALVLRQRPDRIRAAPSSRRKQEVDMLTSTKSGVPEKDRNASVSAAEVIGRIVQHDQTWAKSEPTTKAGMASCIGSDMSIVGNIECKGPAQVFGRIEGEVRASDLQISDGAQVEGSVIAQNVTICGRVKGTIHAVRVKLQSGGAVEGDIFHRSLSIDENSQFEGSSRRVENPTDPSSSVTSTTYTRGAMSTLKGLMEWQTVMSPIGTCIVSKRLGSPYVSGRTRHWLKFKNPAAPAVKREAEEEWG